MSRTANDSASKEASGWSRSRNELFRMIMEGRSFSGRERNCCFLNLGNREFATVSAVSGLDFIDDGRCIAVTDWDGDGDQDLWIANRTGPRLRFMRNDASSASSRHHFVSLTLSGNGRSTNRDAIGARVEIVFPASSGEPPIVKTLRAGEGFLSQSSKSLHFGLGTQDTIQQVVVHWPGGDVESFEGVRVDGHYRLTQRASSAELVDRTRDVALSAGEQVSLPETRVARVVLQSRLPMPSVEYANAAGSRVVDRFDRGSPTLVSLWASWCGPCVQELTELTSRADDLAAVGLRVISLSVDGLPDQAGTREAAQATMNRVSYPHGWGFVDAVQLDRFQQLHNQLFFLRRPLPLPTSFLIDDAGRLAAIYRGPVSAEQLLADVTLSPTGYVESFELAACLPGRAIPHERVQSIAGVTEIHTRYLVAAWLAEAGMDDDAIEHFELLGQMDDKWALPHRHLAKLYLKRRQLDKAADQCLSAMQLDPRDAQAHNTYGLVCSERNDQRNAELHYRKAIQLNDQFAEAHNNLGTLLASQGKLVQAGDSFQRAVELDDQFVQATVNLGSVYAAAGHLDRAIEYYQKAIELDANNVDAHNNVGTMYARQGKFQQAIESYETALRIDPQRADARRNLTHAKTLMQRGS